MLRGGLPRPAFDAPWRYLVLAWLLHLFTLSDVRGAENRAFGQCGGGVYPDPDDRAGFGWLLLRQRMHVAHGLALAIGAVGALWVIFRADVQALLRFEIGRGEVIYFAGCRMPCVIHAAGAQVEPWRDRVDVSLSARLRARRDPDRCWLDGFDGDGLGQLAADGLGDDYLYSGVCDGATFTLLQFAALRLPSSKVMAYTYLVPAWVMVWDVALGAVRAAAGRGCGGCTDGCGVGAIAARLIKFLREEGLERVQSRRLHLPEPLHPDCGGAQRVGVQFAPFHAPALFLGNQPSCGQHHQVFGDRSQRHREGLGHIGDGHIVL